MLLMRLVSFLFSMDFNELINFDLRLPAKDIVYNKLLMNSGYPILLEFPSCKMPIT